jgi:hypothetical protein
MIIEEYVFKQIKREFSTENLALVQKYDKLMVSLSMAKAIREKYSRQSKIRP